MNKRLHICINANEFNTSDMRGDHSVNGVSAASADAYYFYIYAAFKVIVKFKSHFLFLSAADISIGCIVSFIFYVWLTKACA